MAGIASAVAIVFAAYFVLHVLRCADRLRAARLATPAAGPEPARAARSHGDRAADHDARSRSPAMATHCARTVPALAHLLMTTIMAVMLIGMI